MAILAAVLVTPGLLQAADVALQVADTRGQGTLLRRGNECLIVTPRHVVEDENGALRAVFEPIQVIYADRTQTAARTLERFGDDVALLRLKEQPPAGCSDAPFNGKGLERLLESTGEARLRRRKEDGSRGNTPVVILGSNAFGTIDVDPTQASTSINQGDSGSTLVVADQVVGMLISVNADTGIGTVMRADKLLSVIETFMAASTRDASVYLQLDSNSEFLNAILTRDAQRQGLSITADRDAASTQLIVTAEEQRLDTDTGKIVRITARVDLIDALDNLTVEREFKASGNSFVSLDAAADNARKDLAEKLKRAGLLEDLQ